MDSPWVLAIGVFFMIFLMFFFISLLADIVILGVALGCAVLAYNIPALYPDVTELLAGWDILRQLGVALPKEPTPAGYLTLGGMIVVLGTLACIPFLPFSGTYRQMLGANKIGRGDELYVKRLVGEEWERMRRKALEEQRKRKAAPEAKSAPEAKPVAEAKPAPQAEVPPPAAPEPKPQPVAAKPETPPPAA